MKHVTQRLRDGRIELLDVPPPELADHGVLIEVRASLLSAGTERTKVQTGRSSLVQKARARPDQARQVLDKARRDGIRETLDVVRARLDEPAGIGYSAAGIVLEVGSRVRGVRPGDRVACGGGGAVHAEIDHVPANLCVALPDEVSFDEGAFATIGSIGLHGVHQADVRLGERVGVIGLGLVGQLTARILHAAGCVVVGVDLSQQLIDRARACASIDVGFTPDALSADLVDGARDLDAVIIAAATSSSDPVALAAKLCRDRGRVVIVGDVGMDLQRPAFYDKELDLRVSRSYGPGRYDIEYEERGLDYPIGYVRWTERRNMQAFVDLIGSGRLRVDDLVTERVPIEQASVAYERLLDVKPSPLGILLEYQEGAAQRDAEAAPAAHPAAAGLGSVGLPPVGVIGTGSFAQRVLLPGLRAAGFRVASVASARGVSAHSVGRRSDATPVVPEQVLSDPSIGLVVVATRHSTHARYSAAALRSGKHVFVEKPPALDVEQLDDVRRAVAASDRHLVVGFNRRHAPLALALRAHASEPGIPIELLYRVAAERLPPDHWLNDPDEGGGRLVGEGCHFVDFACWVIGALPVDVACTMQRAPETPLACAQSFTVALGFADGSVATIVYGVGSAPRTPKEYVEAHAGGRTAILDDYRELILRGPGRTKKLRGRSDKGHNAQLAGLAALLAGAAEPPQPSHLATMAVTLRALDAARGSLAVEEPLLP